MKYDYWATYTFVHAYDTVQRRAIDYLLGAGEVTGNLSHLADVDDPVARVELLAPTLVTANKSYAQSGDRRTGTGGLKQAIGALNNCFQARMRDALIPLGLLPSSPPLEILPELSFALHVTFTLRKPYLSRDEMDFYVIDNPVRKDKVFRLPYVAPSQWKGALRAAIVRQLAEERTSLTDDEWIKRRLQLTRLFGNEKGVGLDDERCEVYLDDQGAEDESTRQELARRYREALKKCYTDTGFMAGRLHFYPTFFTQMGLEIIHPHSRETGGGQVPILMESVPAGAEGTFALLYVAPGQDETQTRREVVADDLERVADGVRAMLLEDGFGAKTSSGFGVVKNEWSEPGTLRLGLKGLHVMWREDEKPPSVVPASKPTLPPECEEFMEDGEFLMAKPKELRKRPEWGLRKIERYKVVKALYLDYRRRIADWEASQRSEEEAEEVGAAADSPQAGYFSDTFESFEELDRLCQALVAELRKGVVV